MARLSSWSESGPVVHTAESKRISCLIPSEVQQIINNKTLHANTSIPGNRLFDQWKLFQSQILAHLSQTNNHITANNSIM